MGDAAMTAENPPGAVDDVARLGGFGAQHFDQPGIGALRHKADVLAVGLVGDHEAEMPGQRAGFVLGEAAQRKAQELELGAGRGKQEIALVAGAVAGAVQLGPGGAGHPAHIMPGRQRRSAEIARGGEQVAELDPLVAADARHRGFAAAIGFGEILDHRGAKAALVIEHIVGDAEPPGDRGRVIDIRPAQHAPLRPIAAP